MVNIFDDMKEICCLDLKCSVIFYYTFFVRFARFLLTDKAFLYNMFESLFDPFIAQANVCCMYHKKHTRSEILWLRAITTMDTTMNKNINLKYNFKNLRHFFWADANGNTMQQNLFQNIFVTSSWSSKKGYWLGTRKATSKINKKRSF